jgi:hypothetical protein
MVNAAQLEQLSHRRKLRRAEQQIREIESAQQAWSAKAVQVERRDVGGLIELWVSASEDPPQEIGLLLGEAADSLREVLDNLTYSLAEHATPGMTQTQQRQVAFPLSKDRVPETDSRVASLAPDARDAMLNLLQAEMMPTVHDSLWGLSELQNRDKHRAIHVVGAVGGAGRVGVGGNGYVGLVQTFNATDLGPEARLILRAGVSSGIIVNTEPGGYVCLADDSTVVPGMPVVYWLRSVEQDVWRVVLTMEQYL